MRTRLVRLTSAATSSARRQPNVISWSAGRRPILRANQAMPSDAASEKLCSASATSANDPDSTPPTICATVSPTLMTIATTSRRSDIVSVSWEWSCAMARTSASTSLCHPTRRCCRCCRF